MRAGFPESGCVRVDPALRLSSCVPRGRLLALPGPLLPACKIEVLIALPCGGRLLGLYNEISKITPVTPHCHCYFSFINFIFTCSKTHITFTILTIFKCVGSSTFTVLYSQSPEPLLSCKTATLSLLNHSAPVPRPPLLESSVPWKTAPEGSALHAGPAAWGSDGALAHRGLLRPCRLATAGY